MIEKGEKLFIKLKKFDRQFTWFCLSTRMNMGKDKKVSCNVGFFDQMLKMRRVASEKAVHDALSYADLEEAKKKRKVEEDKDLLATPWVQVELPQNELHNITYPAVTMNFLWGLAAPDLWVEFSKANLLKIRVCIRSDWEEGKVGRTRRKSSSPKKSPRKKVKQST